MEDRYAPVYIVVSYVPAGEEKVAMPICHPAGPGENIWYTHSIEAAESLWGYVSNGADPEVWVKQFPNEDAAELWLAQFDI